MKNPSESEGLIQALGRYFDHDSAWKFLAERIAGALASHADCIAGPLDEKALRKSLQAQTFDRLSPRPSPIHLHGDGRVVQKLRHALGL